MSDQVPIENQQEVPEDAQMEESQPSEHPSPEVNIIVNGDEDITARMQEMEREAQRLRELNAQLSQETAGTEAGHPTDEEKRDVDSRSIYIGNVDYASTPLELQQHFSGAGVVNRVTILMNKFTGQPKGFAYLEFADTDSVDKAVATLDGSMFRERQLKVSAKRTNIPGISIPRGGFRGGRGGRGGRGSFRGGPRGRGRGRGGFRGGPRFTPY
ncbi:uncharacterized protein J8A68_002064 [[Candida] subhashii]|uniref:RRM domain-containing protein n=1 Tax=[Candida] subhashii TaxID=561895 RepID=A0A8J5QPR0_9ASCO|nr:uncharacterized protein J8A68_002064 [[Candida] subhashii]KAG7664391.1 hypothetical protein J8A68_002064 [[Candida] subhashii]